MSSIFRSLQWRIGLAYAALTSVAAAVLALYLHDAVGNTVLAVALAALGASLLSIGLAFLLVRRTVRSIRSVTEGARRLALGDLEHRAESRASDETRELASAFNAMANALRDTVQGLSDEGGKLSAVLDTMADGVVLVRSEGRIEVMNGSAGALLGLKPEGARDRPFMEVVRDHDLRLLMTRALESRQQERDEVELLNNRRFVSAIATPLAGSESTGVLLTLHDLTQLRQIETTRREFVSNVSHELRTPLSSVKALAEALENGALEDPDTARDFVRRIHGEADRMSALVDELLELSRLESGQAALVMETVDVATLVRSEVEAFHLRAEATGAVLEARVPDAPVLVRGERDKLRQVLVNLLDNALKFTPSGGTVTVLVHAAAGGVEVSVRDTGAGIPAEHVPHVFERFYKVDRARRDGGTGLGLAIVRHIVEAHGGTARVESREGEGTTVSVILRAAS